jgi:4-hydroxy-3-methylbut-2-enyl diphosphate reductase
MVKIHACILRCKKDCLKSILGVRMHIILAQPRGFCAGAVRAIRTVTRALKKHGPPIYILHEIVHNRSVVEDLKSQGGIFVENIEDIPDGSVIVFSAHGVSTEVVRTANQKNLQIIDGTCPLISEIHQRAQQYSRDGYEIIVIGHPGHPEIEGTRGCIEGPVQVLSSIDEVGSLQVINPDKIAYVTQTTLSYDDTLQIIKALKWRFSMNGPDLSNVCHATQSRQKSVRFLAGFVDLLLIVGAHNSSNSNRLKEIGERCGIASYLIETERDLSSTWFSEDMTIGLTAGASAPEEMVQRVLNRLRGYHPCVLSEMAGTEADRFLPAQSHVDDRKESFRA